MIELKKAQLSMLMAISILVGTSAQAAEYNPEALCEILADAGQEAYKLNKMGVPISRAKEAYSSFRAAKGQGKVDGLLSLYDRTTENAYSTKQSISDFAQSTYDECISKKYTKEQLMSGEGV